MAAVLSSVEPHPASVDAYLRHGWALVPIPPNRKGPLTPKWNERAALLKSSADLPPGWNIGLAHAYSGTCAIDIDDYAASKVALGFAGIDLDALFAAPDAVTIDSGNPGHAKLVYAMPFGLALPGKQITAAKQAVYDLRCATANGLTVQDVLPPSVHPTTGQPYRWGGAGHWQRLPMLPMPLLDLWQTLLLHVEPPEPPSTTAPANWDEVRSAVLAIDASVGRDEWISVGMVLHREDPERGWPLWLEWSRRSDTKFPGERACATQWRSFREDKASVVTLGTLFKLAGEHGWSKPPVDVASLFSSTEAQAPALLRSSVRPPMPQIDLGLFPAVLARRAAEVASSIGCDPLVPLFAGLAAVCACADARSHLEIVHGFEVPPVLWLMTIGDPADKKTPGSEPMFRPLQALEREDRPRFARALMDWEMRQALWAARKKDALEWTKTDDARLGGAPPEVPEEPVAPVPLRLTVNDITSQKLVRHAAERPDGILCALDEMSGWARKIGDSRSGEDRSAWTSSYNGRRYEMDRVGAGTIIADPFSVSIYGNIQPRVYRENLANLSIDGLLQRFVPAVLDGAHTRKGKPIGAAESNEYQWEMLLRTVFALPAQTYTLTPEAYGVFDAFQSWYDVRRRDERLLMADDSYREALGKIEGTAGRMALVFHLIESPFAAVITADTMTRAVLFIRTYVIPALRYSLGELGGITSFDQWLADWIISHADDQTVTLSTIKRASHRQTTKTVGPWAVDQLILGAMRTIELAGWVARMDDGEREHQHHAQWAINPVLLTQFQEHRQSVIAARQRRLDEMYKDNPYGRTKFAHGYEEK